MIACIQVELADRIVGEAELFCLSVELRVIFAKGVGDVHVAGEQSFQAFGLNEIRGKIPDIDLLEIYVDVIPIAFGGRVGGNKQPADRRWIFSNGQLKGYYCRWPVRRPCRSTMSCY